MQQRRYWFKARRYGYGWEPCTSEGWGVLIAALAVFGIFVALSIVFAGSIALFVTFLVLAQASIAVLVFVAWRTGEKPRWRWGGD
jgi:hypothetical protein